MRRHAPRILVAAIAAAALLVVAAPASAGTIVSDNIVQLPLPAGCVAEGGAGGCTPGSVSSPEAVAVSPDGSSVYVVTGVGELTSLARHPGGALTQVDSDLTPGGAATDVAVSPDGENVYSVGVIGAVGVWARAADGTLTQAQTVPGPVQASGVVVSPDGANVYVATDSGVVSFEREADGTLLALPGPVGPADVSDVAVSPDGANVYATSAAAGNVTVFERESDGTLDAIGVSGSLSGPVGLAVSPDGRNVYVADAVGSTIVTFVRSADGSLVQLASLATLANPAGVAVSPDGVNVYAASFGADAIVAFARGTNGALSQVGCVSEAGAGACGTGTALAGAIGVAVSPDGLNVYIASQGSSVAVFARLARVTIDIPTFCDPMYEICGPIPVEPVVPPPLPPERDGDQGPAVGRNRMPDLLPVWLRASCEQDGSAEARVRVHVTRPGLVNLARVRFTIPGVSKRAKVVTRPVRGRTRLTLFVRFAPNDLRASACRKRIVARLDPGDRLTERRERNNTISARIRVLAPLF